MWSTPSNDFKESIFLADFWEKEKLYTLRMISEVGTDDWISRDHTFKVACNIGIKMFNSLFCELNEKGTSHGLAANKRDII